MHRSERDALQRVIDLGQRMCDVLEEMHRQKLTMWDSEGNGPSFVVTPQDIVEHGTIMKVGGWQVDIEGWHRALVELDTHVHGPYLLSIPHRPKRPPPSEPTEGEGG